MRSKLLPFERVKRKVLIKRESETSEKFGCGPDKRAVDKLLNYGVICLNKPAGPTSHQVTDYVKKILDLKKAGHGGTLDPGATGVLPIAFGKSTRIVQTLLNAGKEYVGLMFLHKDVEERRLREVIEEFKGKIKQIPPIKSAVKRCEREREVYYFEILEINGRNVLFKIGCEAGTYIRKLVHDFGKGLNCGAHLKELIRTMAGPFSDKEWWSLQDIEDAYFFLKEECDEGYIRKIVKPVEFAVGHLGKIWVSDNSVDSLCHGANLNLPAVVKLNDVQEEELVAVMTLKDELIALGEVRMDSEEVLKKEKGIVVKIKKVFMERGVYPKFKK